MSWRCEQRWLTAASRARRFTGADLATPGGLYVPQNYDRDFKGPVSAAQCARLVASTCPPCAPWC
ncbi:MAG: hypothetical protein MZV65_44000 [Chromatiales bacterium]|nr:hypothetical protein [Chromatiales bacterium]